MNQREQERREAQAALAKITRKTGIDPQIKSFPECPCEMLNSTLLELGRLRQENRLLRKRRDELLEAVTEYCGNLNETSL
jgi:hypothetical protein